MTGPCPGTCTEWSRSPSTRVSWCSTVDLPAGAEMLVKGNRRLVKMSLHYGRFTCDAFSTSLFFPLMRRQSASV